jgi:hydroxymethylbilane synthase
MYIRIGTRGSKLALVQTEMAVQAIKKVYPEAVCEIVILQTTGDATQAANLSLQKLGGKGLFADSLRTNLEENKADLLVHSMKDLPSAQPPQFAIAAMLERGDPRDCLISNLPNIGRIEDLPQGAVLGTSSPRRAALALRRRPDLKVVNFRGNVPTRLEKLDSKVDAVAATFLANVGLHRLGFDNVERVVFDVTDVLPPAGQGAIGLEIRADDKSLAEKLQLVNHLPTFRCVMAERACVAILDGDCKTSVAAYAIEKDGRMNIKTDLFSSDGADYRHFSTAGSVEDFLTLGQSAGRSLISQIDKKDYPKLNIQSPSI